MILALHKAQVWLKDPHAPLLRQPSAAKFMTIFRRRMAQPVAFARYGWPGAHRALVPKPYQKDSLLQAMKPLPSQQSIHRVLQHKRRINTGKV